MLPFAAAAPGGGGRGAGAGVAGKTPAQYKNQLHSFPPPLLLGLILTLKTIKERQPHNDEQQISSPPRLLLQLRTCTLTLATLKIFFIFAPPIIYST